MTQRSLQAQIAEVQREIEMRRRVYANQVHCRKMRQAEADELINLMQNVLESLHRLASLEK